MRVVVLILALIGAGLTGYLGYSWYSGTNDPEAVEAMNQVVEMAEGMGEGVEQVSEFAVALAQFEGKKNGAYVLFGCSLLGLIGGIVGFRGSKLSGLLLLLAGLAPVGYLFVAESWELVEAAKVLIFSGALVLAGLLGFGVSSD